MRLAEFKDHQRELYYFHLRIGFAGACVLAITDGPLSPLIPHASVAFEVEEVEARGFRSLGATMCLALTLVIGLGYQLDLRRPRRAAVGRA